MTLNIILGGFNEKKLIIIGAIILAIIIIVITILQFTKKETRYQVTFDANGGAHTTMDGGNNVLVQFIENNGTVLKPVDPERAGYSFVGWYTEAGKVFDFNTVITSNIKLIAKWQKKEEKEIISFFSKP